MLCSEQKVVKVACYLMTVFLHAVNHTGTPLDLPGRSGCSRPSAKGTLPSIDRAQENALKVNNSLSMAESGTCLPPPPPPPSPKVQSNPFLHFLLIHPLPLFPPGQGLLSAKRKIVTETDVTVLSIINFAEHSLWIPQAITKDWPPSNPSLFQIKHFFVLALPG